METRLEKVFMACGKAIIHGLGFIFRAIKMLFSKRGLLTVAVIAVLGAGLYYDPSGFWAEWKLHLKHFWSLFV